MNNFTNRLLSMQEKSIIVNRDKESLIKSTKKAVWLALKEKDNSLAIAIQSAVSVFGPMAATRIEVEGLPSFQVGEFDKCRFDLTRKYTQPEKKWGKK
jgi:hypothetical protein